MNSPPRELRLALCMRGGVSLAVWMGGACHEIAALRAAWDAQATDDPRNQRDVYRWLLSLAGYDRVTVDVIAGTSAGGLNGALFVAHLVHGMPFDHRIRNIWLKMGDLESLTRDPCGDDPAQSLLRGDTGFYQKFADQLDELIPAEPPRGFKSPRLVRLILTSTRLFPRSHYIRTSAGDPVLVCTSQSHLKFRHYRTAGGLVHPVFTDLPNTESGRHKLAYAARATSSFPGAFEPAKVAVTADAPDSERNLFGISSDTGNPDGQSNDASQVQIMDGGVLDNMPLSWAIRAVASAPADRPVDRWLLYLQPVPPKTPTMPAQVIDGSLARLLLTIKSFLMAKLNSESLLDDAAELTAAWTTAQRMRGAAGGLPGDLDPASVSIPGAALDRYGNTVACAEADRIARLVEDPIAFAGPDPLPIPSGRAFTDYRVQADVLRQLRGQAIPELVLDCTQSLGPTKFTSPLAAARTVVLALDWVQAVENKGAVPAALEERVHFIRRRLYDVRFACEVLLAARDRVLLQNAQPNPQAWITAANLRLTALVGNRLAGKRKRWSPVLADVAVKAVWGSLPDAPPGSWQTDIWRRVAALCCHFGQSLGEVADVAGFGALYAASANVDGMVETLARAEVILGPLRPDPLAEPSRIQMYAISAASRSPLEHVVFGAEVSVEERVDRKLSGNQLMNFASFLSARWRLNDWIWGRLDAAAALVDVVARSERLGNLSDQTLDWLRSLQKQLSEDQALQGVAAADNNLDLSDQDNIRELLTTWLQWSILRTELPLLTALGESDLPPDDDVLCRVTKPAASLVGKTEVLRKAGGESVRELLSKFPLRRATLRLGLVGWRALLPVAKSSKLSKVLVGATRVALGLVKPLVVPPFVIGFLSPRLSVVSALLGWLAVSVVTGQPFGTPGHAVVACGAAVASGYVVWHFWSSKFKPVLFTVLLVLTGLLLTGLHDPLPTSVPFVVPDWLRFVLDRLPTTVAEPDEWRVLLVGALTAVAALCSLRGVVRAFPLRFHAVSMAGFSAAAGTGLVASHCGWSALTGWWGSVIVYLAVAAEAAVLTYFYPPPSNGGLRQSVGV